MTTISWTIGPNGERGESWNPIVGCSRVSSGCDNCYAISVAARGMCEQHRGLVRVRPPGSKRPGPDWTGRVRLVRDALDKPYHWRDPRRVFVNSMSDLFHPKVSFEVIAAIFGVMANAPRHTFLVLTKRPERARAWFEWIRSASAATPHRAVAVHAWRLGVSAADADEWPLPNVQIGVSVEDQPTADLRLHQLEEIEAAVRWASYEPALGGIDWLKNRTEERMLRWWRPLIGFVDWLVVGGESGRRARPFDVAWARDAVKAAEIHGSVPVFVKQMGRRPFRQIDGTREPIVLADPKGEDWREWEKHGLGDLRVREYPQIARAA